MLCSVMSESKATVDKKVRRFSLKPLVRRARNSVNSEAIANALASLYQLAEASNDIKEILDLNNQDKPSIKDNPQTFSKLTQALYKAGRITTAELALYADIMVENLVEKYQKENRYDHLLQPIEIQISAIRTKYGLEEDEYWSRREEPKEYRVLSKKYDAVFDQAGVDALHELGFEELAAIRQADEKEYHRLRERGRRKSMHEDEFLHALRDLVIRYERDAELAAAANAYYAATTLLGGAVEGLLILRCLRSRHKAAKTAQNLPKRLKPRINNEPQDWRFEVLIEVCAAAGWLPTQHVTWGGYQPKALAHGIRHLRNFVHPASHAKKRPWLEVDAVQWHDAFAMYTLIREQLSPKRRKSLPSNIL